MLTDINVQVMWGKLLESIKFVECKYMEIFNKKFVCDDHN